MTPEKPAEPEPISAPHDSKVRQVELLISNLLRIGVRISLALVVLGTIMTFSRHEDYLSQPSALTRLTAPGAGFPHSLRGVWAGLRNLSGQAVVALGLLLLIATPVMRVAISIFGFLYEKDRLYVLITTTVLALLLISFLLGKAE
jgi:uncharacterized membrane protein